MNESVKNNDCFDADDWADWNENEYAQPSASAPAPALPAPAGPAPAGAAPTPSRQPKLARQPAASFGEPVPHRQKPRNFPGFMARSAMFRVSSSGGEFSEPTTIRAQGCALILTGPMLSMRDKHVWETAVQIAKERAPSLSEPFEIELRDFARRMGSANHNSRALQALWESLRRLALCRVEFEIGASCKGIGSLLSSAYSDGKKLYIRLNPDFALPALKADKQFLFDQARRSKLSTNLAQWLHDFYSTHSTALNLTLGYLRELCGYDGSSRNFPGKLRAAMDELTTAAPTLVASFQIIEAARCSDSWSLSVVLGGEKPSFLPAQPLTSEPKTGRGKVAL